MSCRSTSWPVSIAARRSMPFSASIAAVSISYLLGEPCNKIARDVFNSGKCGSAITRLLKADRTPWVNQVSIILGQRRFFGGIGFDDRQLFGDCDELVKTPIQGIGGRRFVQLEISATTLYSPIVVATAPSVTDCRPAIIWRHGQNGMRISETRSAEPWRNVGLYRNLAPRIGSLNGPTGKLKPRVGLRG